MSDTETIESTTVSPEVEGQARELGWAPKDDFKGDPEKWVDAKTYLDRGEQVLPLVKATNRRLREDLTRTTGKVGDLETALKQSQETIAALQEFHETEIADRVKRARADLLTQLKEAKRDENVDREVELTDELSRLNAASIDPPKKRTNGSNEAETPRVVDYTKDPDFISWQEDNAWFGADVAKTQISQGVAQQLRIAGDKTIGKVFLDKVSAGTQKEIARLTGRPAPSKVEESRGGSDSSTSGEKSYSDLPAEAKEACDKFARDARLVGTGKLHKDAASFRKHYVAQYYRDIL